MLTIIIGGVRSGKSSLAERLAEDVANAPLVYIATSVPTDEEMKQRITAHQQSREESKRTWITLEQPSELEALAIPQGSVVLLDCLTTWATNEWIQMDTRTSMDALGERMVDVVRRLHTYADQVIIVSNDLFCDVQSLSSGVRSYTSLLGLLHQRIVQLSDRAVRMEWGHPVLMKGASL